MSHHDLKILSCYFAPKVEGRKPWEIRSTEDRWFMEQDTVTFHELFEGQPTGRTYGPCRITYVLTNGGCLKEGYVVFTHGAALLGEGK